MQKLSSPSGGLPWEHLEQEKLVSILELLDKLPKLTPAW